VRTADEAINAHGLTGPRVLGIVRDVANYSAARTPFMWETTRHDLESFLTEVACTEAVRYDPPRSGPGYSFASYRPGSARQSEPRYLTVDEATPLRGIPR
jgi:hypothetical protein